MSQAQARPESDTSCYAGKQYLILSQYGRPDRKPAGVSAVTRSSADAPSREQRWRVGGQMRGDWVEMIFNIISILNLTTPKVQYQNAKKSITNGKHVYSEKPLANNLKEGNIHAI